MNRNAFTVPLLNRDGVIPSEQTTIQVPDTIDSSFLTTIKNNPNANFLYEGNYYTYKGTRENISFFMSMQTEYHSETLRGYNKVSDSSQITLTFTLPTKYSKDDYQVEANQAYVVIEDETNNNVIKVTSKNITTYFKVTVKSLKPTNLTTLGLTINFINETPSINAYTIDSNTEPVNINIHFTKKRTPYISAPTILNKTDSEGRGGLYDYCASIRSTDTLYAAFLSCQKGAKRTLYDRKKRRIKDDNGELINFSTANIGELYNITKSKINDYNNLPEAEEWTVVEDYSVLPYFIYDNTGSSPTQTPLKVWSCSYQDELGSYTKRPYFVGKSDYLRWYWALAETDEFNLLYLYRCVLFLVDDILYFVIYRGTKLLQR